MQHPHVVSWGNVASGENDADPNNPLFDTRILAEGDSWFSLGSMPTSNLLFNLKFNGFAIVVNCARPGDTIRNMGRISGNPNLKKAMSRRFGYAWDAILLSGGGNDVIDDIETIIRRFSRRRSDPAEYCNLDQLDKTLESVKKGYRRIIELRDMAGSSCRDKPVITHTYDWMTPRNAPARFFPAKILGPWICTALKKARVPESEWNAISDFVVNSLRETIKGLAGGANSLPSFHVVDTQDSITPAALGDTGVSGDWMNEIHPSVEGYRKIAARISTRVRKLL